ncbi:MAG: hypothetical protein WCV62_03420 [Candidatus Peribacteraceae bacterium]|jgi:hypothetical protein
MNSEHSFPQALLVAAIPVLLVMSLAMLLASVKAEGKTGLPSSVTGTGSLHVDAGEVVRLL